MFTYNMLNVSNDNSKYGSCVASVSLKLVGLVSYVKLPYVISLESAGCEILRNDACAMEGHSPSVNTSEHQKEMSLFPMVFYPYSHSKLLTRCEKSKDVHLFAKFACAWMFPVCRRNGTVLPPCRSLCSGEYRLLVSLIYCSRMLCIISLTVAVLLILYVIVAHKCCCLIE